MFDNNNGGNNGKTVDFQAFVMEYIKRQEEDKRELVAISSGIKDSLGLYSTQLMAQERAIKNIYCTIDDIKSKIEDNTNDIITIKENDRITSAQRGKITDVAYTRIAKFLQPNSIDWELYSTVFFFDLYRYLRQNHYLQKPISESRKKDFDNIMSGFDAWYPDITALKLKADMSRNNRRLAQEL